MRKGFTLIELLVVVGLIMILSAVGIGTFTSSTIKSKDTQRKNDIAQLSRAIESFALEVGRYPVDDGSGNLLCYEKVGSTGSDLACISEKFTVRVDGVSNILMTIPKDPNPDQKYIYKSIFANEYELYAALENAADKDLLQDDDGEVLADPFGVDCGSVKCNYKVTESGKVNTVDE